MGEVPEFGCLNEKELGDMAEEVFELDTVDLKKVVEWQAEYDPPINPYK